MKYDRTVIAYHGCDAEIAERLLHGESFKMSQNDYDWLGEGIYFWEYGADRALQFAHDQKARGKVKAPSIVGALVQLGRCFDLMDTRFTDELPCAFATYKQFHRRSGKPLPKNRGKTPDKLLRHRDCAVLNFYCPGCGKTVPPRTTPFGVASSKGHLRTQGAASGTKAMSRSLSGTLLAWWACSGPQ